MDDSGIIVEKSVADITRLEFLAAHFEPAYFIHIVRNGYAVSEGIMRRSNPRRWGRHEFGDSYPAGLCADQWQRSYERFRESRDGLKNVLELTYESFTEHPAGALSAVAEFLEIDAFDPSLLAQEWSFREITSKITNMNARSIERLSISEKKAIDAAAGALLSELGYRKTP